MFKYVLTITFILLSLLTPISCAQSETSRVDQLKTDEPHMPHPDTKRHEIPSPQGGEGKGEGGFSNGNNVLILQDRKYFETLMSKINNAQSDITVSMYIFTTSGKKTNSANRIKDALIKAARRGINVQILLERENRQPSSLNHENEYTAGALKKGGAKVYFDTPNRRTHVKAVVIDSRYTFIGSHNLTSSALHYNRELSVMFDSEEVAETTLKYINDIIEKSM